MKKFIAVIILAMSIVACGQFQSPQQLSTQTAVSLAETSVASTAVSLASTATASSWTPTAPPVDYTGDLGIFSGQLFEGPDTKYPVAYLASGKVTIVGQAYQCAWFKVISKTDPSQSGWISADKFSHTVACADVKQADFPPVPVPTSTDTPIPPTDTPIPPTDTPIPVVPTAPKAPSAPSVSCQVNSNIIIQNRSGAAFTIYLTGPGSFTFYISAGAYQTVKVCSGSYNYTIYGTCNGSPASGSGRISDGDQVYFACR